MDKIGSLSLDKPKSKRTKQYNFTILGVAISISAVIISATQILLAYISKERELDQLSIQKETELSIQKMQNDRTWKLEIVKFITQNQTEIFSEDIDKRKRIRDLITLSFPPEITNVFFQRLEMSAQNSEIRQFWKDSQIIRPHAKAAPINGKKLKSGKQVYKFSLWLEISDNYKSKIYSAEYIFDHPSFIIDKVKESKNQLDGFKVEYEGWGAINSVDIILTLMDGTKVIINVNMLELLGWDDKN
jgi:hypothetical protein